MPVFAYRGLQPSGRKVEGEIEAEDREAVVRHLQKGDLFVTGIRQKRIPLIDRLGLRRRRLQDRRAIFFARSLATLHRSGVALSESLHLIASQASDPYEKKVIESVRTEVMKGMSLADALVEQAPAFPDILAGSVEVGEAAGVLDTTLESAAALLEREEAAKAELKAALRYPTFVLVAIGVALVVLLTLVVPPFADSYAEMGVALPTPTLILIEISQGLVQNWPSILAVLGVLGTSAWRWSRTRRGRRQLEELLFRIPILGSVVIKSLTSRTCAILKVLFQSGLPVLRALEMSAKTIGNPLVASELLAVRNAVAEGSDIASRFRASEVFPPLAGELISVGERSGALEEMLGAAAEYFRQEADRERRRMAALIEPTLTISLGMLVLGIALAIFLPMWDSISLYRGG